MSDKVNKKTLKKKKIKSIPKFKCKTEIVKIPDKIINKSQDGMDSDNKSANSSTNSKQFTCVLCQKTFAIHSRLITHFRMHGSNEIDLHGNSRVVPKPTVKIECEWCTETFPTITKAIEHKFRKHQYASTNYFCKLCGKLFPLNIVLQQHMTNVHKLEKNYEIGTELLQFSCEICSLKFVTEDALHSHNGSVHKLQPYMDTTTVVPPPSMKIRAERGEIVSLYYCHLCGSEYKVKYNLKKHLIDHHTVEEKNALPESGIIKCTACEAIFYNQRAYDTHNLHHKPDDLYATSELQRQNIVTRVDQDFDIRRIPTRND